MTRTIIVPNRIDGWLYGTKEITVDWNCPVCGKEMGEPKLLNFCEDGEFYVVHMWSNPCQHITKYSELKEVIK